MLRNEIRLTPLCAALLAVAFVSATPAPRLQAQTTSEEMRAQVSFTAGASLGDGNTALASAVGVAIRVAPRISIAVELAHARKLDFTLDLCPPPLVCIRGGQLPVTGRTVSLVPHLAIDLLPESQRLRVYAQAGAGLGHVRQRWFDGALSGDRTEFTRSSTTPATSFGGGVAVAVAGRLAVGVDVRSLHLFDREPELQRHITPAGRLSTVRVGAQVIWMF